MFRRVNTPAALRERTALVPFPHTGHCAKINRTQASFELIDVLDIGVVTDFLPDAPARAILEQMKTLPDRCAGVCAQAERG